MDSGSHTAKHAGNHRAMAIAGLLILSLALRPGIVSISPILLAIQDAFKLSYAQASLLTTIPDICMGVFALFAPRIARTFGSDRSVVAALVVLGAAIVARALAGSAGLLLLSTVFVGIGIAIAGSLIGGWIKTHFPHEASFFMGIYAAGLSVGATAAAVLTDYLSRLSGGWRIAAAVWALLCVSAILSWLGLARRFAKPAEHAPDRRGRPVAALPLPLRNAQAWLIAIFFGCSQFIVYACFAWLAPSSSEMQISTLRPGLVLALFTLTFAVGSFGIGVVAAKTPDRRGWLAASMTLTALGLAGLAFAPATFPTLFIMLAAFGQGMCFTLGMTLPLDHTHTPAESNVWTVFTLFVGYLIAALGPFVFGALRDATGRFFSSYSLLLGVSVIMCSMIPLLKPKPAAEERGRAVQEQLADQGAS
jgi:CP family cyanate transporter-like MFS transporter